MLRPDYAVMPDAWDRCAAERHLLHALLDRAVRDALGESNVPYARKAHRRAAQEWFGLHERFYYVANPNPFSFHWVAEHLRLSAERIHRCLSEALANGPRPDMVRLLTYRIKNRCFRYPGKLRKIKTAA